jgi:hypothetical protein
MGLAIQVLENASHNPGIFTHSYFQLLRIQKTSEKISRVFLFKNSKQKNTKKPVHKKLSVGIEMGGTFVSIALG